MGFGADGYLYITTGDSSSGARGPVSQADKLVQQLAQTLQDMHGKVLRIDVDKGTPYAIPATNPYADPNDGVLDEIYAYGLRNPWRWSFDRLTGDFWVGDLGQDDWEELNVTLAGVSTPQNYGWPCFQGSHAYVTSCTLTGTYHAPLLDYGGYTQTGNASSITGGFVYRGSTYPDLWGWYVYGDYSRGTYWTLKRNPDGSYQHIQQMIPSGTTPVSFSEGLTGELYVLSFDEGTLYHVQNVPITSLKSGSWTDLTTWNCACLPTHTDRVIISAGHTVTASQAVQAKVMQIEGKLVVQNAATLSIGEN